MSLAGSLSLIFGGCCSNVYALEAIIKHEPDSGLLITTAQLLLVAFITLPTQLEHRASTPSQSSSPAQDGPDPAKPHVSHAYTHHDPHPASTLSTLLLPYRIRKPSIPFSRLLISSTLFLLVNMLNNWAFAFDISVPMHIILRSFGSVMTLVVGWCVGKTYGKIQVLGVMGLTVGVVMAAWADAAEKGADLSVSAPANSSTSGFATGLLVLFLAQLLAAFMGVYTETTYARHGRHWQETLFYSHAFGLLFSLFLWPSLTEQLRRLTGGPTIAIPVAACKYSDHIQHTYFSRATRKTVQQYLGYMAGLQSQLPSIPSQYKPSQPMALLILNSFTQYACITGVNRLGAYTSAVTVTVVLNIRKLASFLLSCFIFGNELTPMMVQGATVVFASGAVYGLGGALGKSKQKPKTKVDQPRDSLAIAKGYATGALNPSNDLLRERPNGQAWQEVRDSVKGMMNEGHTVAGMSEMDDSSRELGDDAIVHDDGTMSPRRARKWSWSERRTPRRESWATASGSAVLNADGTMSRR